LAAPRTGLRSFSILVPEPLRERVTSWGDSVSGWGACAGVGLEGGWLLANTSVVATQCYSSLLSHFPPLHAPLPRPHSAHSDQQGSHAMANCANRRKGLGKRRNHLVAARGCHPPPPPVVPQLLSFGSKLFSKTTESHSISLTQKKIPDTSLSHEGQGGSTPRLGCEQAWVGVDGGEAARNLPSMITRSRLSCAREPDPPRTPTRYSTLFHSSLFNHACSCALKRVSKSPQGHLQVAAPPSPCPARTHEDESFSHAQCIVSFFLESHRPLHPIRLHAT